VLRSLSLNIAAIDRLDSKQQQLTQASHLIGKRPYERRTIVPLFLRKLVLGIQAQASGKNDAATHAFGGPSRPATLATSLYHAR
jgi:hypothetical protein